MTAGDLQDFRRELQHHARAVSRAQGQVDASGLRRHVRPARRLSGEV